MAHQCQYCSDVYKTIPQRDQHARLAHKEIIHVQQNWIPCPNCKQYFANERSAIEHTNNNCYVLGHFLKSRNTCQECKKIFRTKKLRLDHARVMHPTANHCQFCTKVYTDIYNCYRHARLAHNEAIQRYWIPCPNCQMYFPTKKTLNTHSSTNCLGCEHCNKVLNSKNERRNHVEQNHLEEMSKYWTIFCLICDGKFENDRGFGLHLTTCQRKEQIICQECKKIFSTKELMLAHARVMHAKQVRLGSVMGPVIKRCPFLKNIFSKNSKNSKRFFKNFEKNRKKFYHTICTC
jgi:hypothetical protein